MNFLFDSRLQTGIVSFYTSARLMLDQKIPRMESKETLHISPEHIVEPLFALEHIIDVRNSTDVLECVDEIDQVSLCVEENAELKDTTGDGVVF